MPQDALRPLSAWTSRSYTTLLLPTIGRVFIKAFRQVPSISNFTVQKNISTTFP